MAQVSYGTITITDTNDIEQIYMVYAGSESNVTPPDVSDFALWKTDVTQTSGTYIWQRTVVKKSGIEITAMNFQQFYGEPVCVTGDGGRSIKSITTYYCNYGTGTPEENYSGWNIDTPEYDEDKPNYWVKTVIIYVDDSEEEFELSGDIVTFEDGEHKHLTSFTATINPKQSGSGDPSPDNICPISGWTEVVTSITPYEQTEKHTITGKNIFNAPNDASSTLVACHIDANQSFVASANISCGIRYYDATKTQIDYWSTLPNSYGNRKYRVISSSTAIEYVEFYGSGSPTDLMIELGTTPSDYEPYGYSYTTDLPETVYGGTLDVVNGVLNIKPYYASYNGETLSGEWISDRDVYSDGRTPTIGAQVVNVGATGTNVQLTPKQVTTLLGTNNVWADSGDVSVSGFTIVNKDIQIHIDNGLTEAFSKAANALEKANEAESIAIHANEDSQGALSIATGINQHFFSIPNDYSTSVPAGSYITEINIDEFKQSPSGGNLLTRSDGIWLRNGADILASLQGTGLTFLIPTGTYKGRKSLEILGGTTPALKLYDAQNNNAVATLDSNGLVLSKGGIRVNTVGSNNGIYISSENLGSKVTSLDADKINWRAVIGSKFGVDSEGNLYANEAHISGEITASKLTISSNATINDTSGLIRNDAIDIGGRNLVLNTAEPQKGNIGSRTTITDDYATLAGSTADWGATWGTSKMKPDLLDGTTVYTVSFEYRSTAALSDTLLVISGSAEIIDSSSWTRSKYVNWKSSEALPSTGGEWVKHSLDPRTISLSQLTSGSGDVNSFFLQLYNRSNEVSMDVRHFKLEKGNKATDWTPAPEDLENAALSRTQRIYYRSDSSTLPNSPTENNKGKWFEPTQSDTGYNTWSRDIVPLIGGFHYLFMCDQTQTAAQYVAGNECTNSSVMRDDSTSVIDGGSITTGRINANYIDASTLQIGYGQVDGLGEFMSLMTFKDGVLRIAKPGSRFAVELSDDGLFFKQNDTAVSYINMNRLYIPYAVVLDQMMIGKEENNSLWAWTSEEDGSLTLKWIGGNN